jgi:hypothetical protein
MFESLCEFWHDKVAEINWLCFGGPKPFYGCIQEVQMDNGLKRELSMCIPMDSGFGKFIKDLSRPITIEEVNQIHVIIAAARADGRYAVGMRLRMDERRKRS